MDRRHLLKSLLVAPLALFFPKLAAAQSSVSVPARDPTYRMASVSMRIEPGDLPKYKTMGTECPFVEKLREAMLKIDATPVLDDQCPINMTFYHKDGSHWGRPVKILPKHLFKSGRWEMLRLGVALAGRARRPWLETSDVGHVFLTFFIQ